MADGVNWMNGRAQLGSGWAFVRKVQAEPEKWEVAVHYTARRRLFTGFAKSEAAAKRKALGAARELRLIEGKGGDDAAE